MWKTTTERRTPTSERTRAPRWASPGADCLECVGMHAWVLADVWRILKPVPYHRNRTDIGAVRGVRAGV